MNLKRSYTRKHDRPRPTTDLESFANDAIPARIKAKSVSNISSKDISDMLAEMKATKISQSDAAIRYNFKKRFVSRMVCA